MEAAAEDNQKDKVENVQPENNATEKTATPPPQESNKKSKKDDKNVEQMYKSLESAPLEEKKQFCRKYVQACEDNKKLQFYIKQSDKRFALHVKEKDQLQLEYNKTVLVKSKLENLCRELQKQNKAIKEESLLKIREEEERRKETQAKFQNTLSEITALLHQNNEKNSKLRDDNISMSEKFKSVVQQYQLREQQVDKMAKQMALESQLSDAKLQKASLEHQAERERLMAEMEQMKVTLAQYRAKVLELQGNETGLRSQLAVYTDKYDEFQNALVKSNQVFGGFKEQMEKMSKKIKKLEKESLSWKKRWETSQTALLDMCGERQASEERAAAAARQLLHMQSLCRTLQAERTALLSTLKEHNIERPALATPPPALATPPPALAPAPAPAAPASNAKVDAMAANCVQLRQSLAHLQSQLNVLTNKPQTTEEPPKPEKQKKSKSKKNKDKKSQDKVDTPKETESDDTKDTDENQPSASEDTAQSDLPEDKVDEKTLENLIQAIKSSTNMNLSELEVSNEELEDTGDIVEEVLKDLDSPINATNTEVLNSKSEIGNVEVQSIEKGTNEEPKDVAVVETSVNDEVPHIAEVKPIKSEA